MSSLIDLATMSGEQAETEPVYFTDVRFADDTIFHGFFSRNGGTSQNSYASLNCGWGSDDEPGCIANNLMRVSKSAGVEYGSLTTLHQVHSAECVVVDAPWSREDRPKADAFVTKTPGFALGILTADCGPVLFHGRDGDDKPVIGAAHAGWGGAFKGVLQATVQSMKEIGAQPESIKASIGPCIGQNSYEVGPEFYQNFIEQADENDRFFKSSNTPEHMMFDLAGYCALQLASAGVKQISIKDLDTYYNEEDFFSYRRATHRKVADYGRQISVVAIKEN
jgi:YfiH family protein